VENAVRRPKSAATSVVDNTTIFVHLEGIIDFVQEMNRLDKEINKLTNELSIVSKKLRNEDFLSKAPKDVVEKVKEKQEALMEKQQKLQTNLDKIKELES
jgi:valyl-tRNA synthetase